VEAELFFVTHLFLRRADAMARRSSGITYLAIPRSASRTPCDWQPSQILFWQHRQNKVKRMLNGRSFLLIYRNMNLCYPE
jgi:hypothetical protein